MYNRAFCIKYCIITQKGLAYNRNSRSRSSVQDSSYYCLLNINLEAQL